MAYIISDRKADNFRIINKVRYHAGLTSHCVIVCNNTFTKTELDKYDNPIKDDNGNIKSSEILERGFTITELSMDKFFKFAKIALEKCNEWFGTDYKTDFYVPTIPFMDNVYDMTRSPKDGSMVYADWRINIRKRKYNDWDGWKKSDGIEMSSQIHDCWLDSDDTWRSNWEVCSYFNVRVDMFKEICKVLNDYLSNRDDLHKVCGDTLDVEIPMILTARNVCDMYKMYTLYQKYLGNDNIPSLTENNAAWFIKNVDTSNLRTCYDLCYTLYTLLTDGKVGEVEEVTSNQCLWYQK